MQKLCPIHFWTSGVDSNKKLIKLIFECTRTWTPRLTYDSFYYKNLPNRKKCTSYGRISVCLLVIAGNHKGLPFTSQWHPGASMMKKIIRVLTWFVGPGAPPTATYKKAARSVSKTTENHSEEDTETTLVRSTQRIWMFNFRHFSNVHHLLLLEERNKQIMARAPSNFRISRCRTNQCKHATSPPCLGHLNSFLGDLSHKLFVDTNIKTF